MTWSEQIDALRRELTDCRVRLSAAEQERDQARSESYLGAHDDLLNRFRAAEARAEAAEQALRAIRDAPRDTNASGLRSVARAALAGREETGGD